MKAFFVLLKTDLKRALLSMAFVLSVLLILLVMFISCAGFITGESDAIGLLEFAFSGSGSTLFILCIAPILPYGMSFASDLEDKAPPYWVIRTGMYSYSVSKFISSALSGFLSVFVSIVCFCTAFSLFFPLYHQEVNDSYAIFLEADRPILYILVFAVHYSLSAALFSGAAMTVSTFLSDKFSVMAVPIVIFFILMRITDPSSMPRFLKPSFLVQDIYSQVSPLTAFLYKLIPVIVLLIFLLIVAVRQMKKRMEA